MLARGPTGESDKEDSLCVLDLLMHLPAAA